MKKRIIALLTCLSMLFALTACGGTSPSDAIKAELDSVKDASSDSIIQQALSSADLEDTDLLEPVVANIQGFEYEILGEEVDGDTAKVTVSITTAPFGDIFTDAYDEVLNDVLSGKLTDFETRDIVERLYKPLAEATDKTYTKEVVINCTKDGKNWVGDFDTNDEFIDAVFGGLMGSLQGLA